MRIFATPSATVPYSKIGLLPKFFARKYEPTVAKTAVKLIMAGISKDSSPLATLVEMETE